MDPDVTFRQVAERVFDIRKQSLTNAKFRGEWLRVLELHAYAHIGDMPIAQITPSNILDVLEPIWLAKEETAKKVIQRMRMIFDYAKVRGLYEGENPVAMMHVALPKQTNHIKHFTALPYAEAPAFIKRLRQQAGMSNSLLAFEWLILTATRTSETLDAQWNEIDFNNMIWNIPPERMKMGKIHRVPLSPRAMEILEEQDEHLSMETPYLFPARKLERPLSNMVFLQLLKRMKVPVTAHGFRSSFRDWAAEETEFSYDVCEAALAHAVADKVAAAYIRTDYFRKRTALMTAWSDYLNSS